MDALFGIFQKPRFVLRQSYNECTGKCTWLIANKLLIVALIFYFESFENKEIGQKLF